MYIEGSLILKVLFNRNSDAKDFKLFKHTKNRFNK